MDIKSIAGAHRKIDALHAEVAALTTLVDQLTLRLDQLERSCHNADPSETGPAT